MMKKIVRLFMILTIIMCCPSKSVTHASTSAQTDVTVKIIKLEKEQPDTMKSESPDKPNILQEKAKGYSQLPQTNDENNNELFLLGLLILLLTIILFIRQRRVTYEK